MTCLPSSHPCLLSLPSWPSFQPSLATYYGVGPTACRTDYCHSVVLEQGTQGTSCLIFPVSVTLAGPWASPCDAELPPLLLVWIMQALETQEAWTCHHSKTQQSKHINTGHIRLLVGLGYIASSTFMGPESCPGARCIFSWSSPPLQPYPTSWPFPYYNYSRATHHLPHALHQQPDLWQHSLSMLLSYPVAAKNLIPPMH